ncbi:hypothetical protein JL12_00910 [Gallibacterium anatis 10672-6]|uniref:oligosaccharide flippase family protein n=1 Tax=Gallibacterium anatis TaxID=750 RepID=UPI000530C72B|nr:oligosaccharide flippase family protein [Gallibacterium anatis]KGQ52459.1 hypothetical protein JL12_00910 [Gallibacterium anatis 10672-6]
MLVLKSKTLKDLLKVFSGNVVSQGIAFLIIIIISRDLGPSEYGIFSSLIAIFTIGTQISDFGVSTSYVKYASENLSKEDEIFITIVIGKVIVSIFTISIFYLLSGRLSEFFFGTRIYQDVIKIVAIGIFFHSLFLVVISHFQAKQNFLIFSCLNIVHNFLKLISIIIICITFSKESHLKYFIFSYVFCVSILILALVLKGIIYIKNMKKFEFIHFINTYKLGFWIFLSSMAVVIMMRLDIIMLQKMGSSSDVGYYSAAMNLAMIFPLITTSIVTTLLPKMESFLKNYTIQEYIIKVVSNIKYIIFILIIIEIISPYLIKNFFGEKYIESISVFQILLVAFVIGIIINPISLIMYSINKAYMLTLLNWIQLPVNYFFNIIFIPSLYADGAALSTMIVRILGGLFIIIYFFYFKGRKN